MQFPSEKFDGTELDHWNLFMQYWNYVLRKGYVPGQNDANYFATFREQFVLTPSGIAYSWFMQVIPTYHDIEDVKAAFLKRFNEWGQTVKQHMNTWNNLRFDLNKHDMDIFTCQLQWLASILYMTEDQTLEKFKDVFDLNIAVHLIECATLDKAREKAEKLVFIYKNNNPLSASSVLMHTQLNDKREIQEHELATVEKVNKQCNIYIYQKKPVGVDNSHIINNTPHNIMVIAPLTEDKVTFNREVDSIIEEITKEVGAIIRMIKDKASEAEVMEEAMDMTKIRTIIGPTTNMVEVEAIDHGEPMGIIPGDVDLHQQVLGIHNTRIYCNISIYAVSVIAEGITTISVILSSICFMLCNNKLANKWPNLPLNMTIQTKLINRLFRTGIPQPLVIH